MYIIYNSSKMFCTQNFTLTDVSLLMKIIYLNYVILMIQLKNLVLGSTQRTTSKTVKALQTPQYE